MRQLGGKQELPQIADKRKFVTDHENGRVAFAEDMHRMWRYQRVLGELVPNRFRPECLREYKKWLKKSLTGTIEPGQNVPHIIAYVGAKHQVRLNRLQERFDRSELEHKMSSLRRSQSHRSIETRNTKSQTTHGRFE